MKRAFSAALVLSLAALFAATPTVFAGDDDGENGKEDHSWRRWKQSGHKQFHGFCAFEVGYQAFSSSDLEQLASDMGIDFPSDLYLLGGFGMANIHGNWFIGGGGFGGDSRVSGIAWSDSMNKDINKEMEIGMGGGGVLVEWAPLFLGPVNIGAGSMLGGGGVTVRLLQHSGVLSWARLAETFRLDPDYEGVNVQPGENSSVTLHQGFMMAQPYITARMRILDWLALSGTAGYTLTTMSESKWDFDNTPLSGKGPKFDIHQPFFKCGLLLGG